MLRNIVAETQSGVDVKLTYCAQDQLQPNLWLENFRENEADHDAHDSCIRSL